MRQKFFMACYNFCVFLDRTWQAPRVKMGVVKCRPTPRWLYRLADFFYSKANPKIELENLRYRLLALGIDTSEYTDEQLEAAAKKFCVIMASARISFKQAQKGLEDLANVINGKK